MLRCQKRQPIGQQDRSAERSEIKEDTYRGQKGKDPDTVASTTEQSTLRPIPP